MAYLCIIEISPSNDCVILMRKAIAKLFVLCEKYLRLSSVRDMVNKDYGKRF